MPRIIYLDPKWGNNMYPYYFGTISELALLGVEIIHEVGQIKSVKELAGGNLRVDDVIVFGLGWFGTEYFWNIDGLDELKNRKIVYYHKPFNNQGEKDQFIRTSNIDILLSTTPGVSDIEARTNTKTILFPYACNDRVFGLKDSPKKKYDVGFSGALHAATHYDGVAFSSPDLRVRAQYKIDKYFAGKKFINGSDKVWKRMRSDSKYAGVLASSKTWLSTTGPLHDMSSRYFEVSCSRTVPLTNRIPDDYSHIFKADENVIVFKEDCSNLLDKLSDSIENGKVLDEMACNLRDEGLPNHSYKVRAKELLTVMESL